MWPDLVALLSPLADNLADLVKVTEQVNVEHLVAQASTEALDIRAQERCNKDTR